MHAVGHTIVFLHHTVQLLQSWICMGGSLCVADPKKRVFVSKSMLGDKQY